jgi:hypothetical protein
MRRLAALVVSLLPIAAPAALADSKDTLNAARAAYYSLRREGLTGFTCQVSTNWDAILAAQRRGDPAAADRLYQALTAIPITVDVGPGRRPKVTHGELPDGTPEETQTIKTIIGGLEEALSGFFDTWSPFVVASPIPPETAELVEAHDRWSAEYKDARIQLWLSMRKNYTIDVMRIAGSGFESTIQPQFTPTAKGMILTAVQGEYRPLPSGARSSVQLRIDYHDVGAFSLPRRVISSSARDGRTQTQMDLVFSNCQARGN